MDRRRAERLEKWLPVRLDGDQPGLAVTHNANERGVLLVTAQTLEIGTEIVISVPTSEDGDELHLEGRVVRFSKNNEDPQGLWPHAVAIEFTRPYPAFETLLRSLEP